MNNSFARLIDGMNATLRSEVLTRLDDEFARGQVFGIINLLNTFKVRADWSAGFLLQQIAAQRTALDGVAALLQGRDGVPLGPTGDAPQAVPIANLLARRDEGNRAIGELLAWFDAHRTTLAPQTARQLDALLRTAMRAEVSIELKNSPRPLFAEMSSGTEEPPP
jgi:DNA-binding FrmR family transcriptional regulator